jgi:hypothetical protein
MALSAAGVCCEDEQTLTRFSLIVGHFCLMTDK